MAWEIKYSAAAQKTLLRMENSISRRIVKFLDDRIAPLDNPRSIGEALSGSSLGDYWKYRVGDFRIVAQIEDKVLHITVIKIGNRREVYR